CARYASPARRCTGPQQTARRCAGPPPRYPAASGCQAPQLDAADYVGRNRTFARNGSPASEFLVLLTESRQTCVFRLHSSADAATTLCVSGVSSRNSAFFLRSPTLTGEHSQHEPASGGHPRVIAGPRDVVCHAQTLPPGADATARATRASGGSVCRSA